MLRKKITAKDKDSQNIFVRLINQVKSGESFTNLILGAIVVIVIAVTVVVFVRNNKEGQTSSTESKPTAEENGMVSSTYTVKAGDSLWSISEKTYKSGYNWKEIAKANNLENPNVIHAGNKLNLPKVEKQIETDDAKSVNDAISGNSYTVKRGDNLWNISVRAYDDGFRYGEIAKANNLVNPRLIHSGNVLIIPRK